MKRRILLLALACAFAIPASAQLVITSDPFGNVQAPVDQGGWHDFKLTLIRNVTFTFVGVPPPSQSQVTVTFIQDGTGARVVTFGGNIVSPGCPIISTPNTTTFCFFHFDSTTNLWTWIPTSATSSQLHGNGPPSNPCTNGFFYTDDTTGNAYSCKGSSWVPVSTLGGSGAPVNPCAANSIYTDNATGNQYSCNAGSWLFVGPVTTTTGPACSTDAFTATPTYTFAGADQCHIMTLTGNVTSITINGTPANHTQLFLKFPEDGTGGRTVIFPGSFVFPTNFSFHIAPNNQNNMGWTFDGTLWRPTVDFGGGGGGGSPSGSNGAVQTQNGGAFGASGNVFDLNSVFSVNEDSAFKGLNPVGSDIRGFGGASFNPNLPPAASGITATCNGTTTITLSAASLFVNGVGIIVQGCGTTNAMSTPSAPTVTTNLAQAGMNTGNVVAGLTGATTYNYKVAAQNLTHAVTAASAAGSVTTGPASLVAQTVNLTSCIRSNATVTCITSSAHGITVGAQIKLKGQGDPTFNGEWQAATVPDNTHFTFTQALDTRVNGALANVGTTGGTVTWWPCNHLTWPAVTGAYRYGIYSDRGSPGTFNLIGISKPSYPGSTATDGSLYFDDFGTNTTYGTPPWSMPATAPAAAINNALETTIVSGAGTTTVTVANAASQTLAATPIRADNCQNIKSAASGGVGSVFIPAGGDFVTNSICDLSTIGSGVTIQMQNNTQQWGDTVIFGQKGGMYGNPLPIIGGSAGFIGQSYPIQLVFGQPGFHFASTNPLGGNFTNLELDGQSNGQVAAVFDTGGPNIGYEISNIVVQNVGGTDDMAMPLFVRFDPVGGGSGQFVSHGRITLIASQTAVSETPALYVNGTGGLRLSELYFSGRGAMFQAHPSGSQVTIPWYYCQGCVTPFISVVGAKTGGGAQGFNLTVNQLVNDTSFSPLITSFNASGSIVPTINFGQSFPGTTVGYSGVPAQYVSGQIGGQNINSESQISGVGTNIGALDNIFNSASVGTYANRVFDTALSTGDSYPIFVTGPTMAFPALAFAAGGSVPTGSHIYQVTPVWPNNGTGPNSIGNSITVTTGNQTVNLTWTALGATAGCIGYYILRDGLILQTPGSPVGTCATNTFSDTAASAAGTGPGITSGGPSMAMPGFQGLATPKIDLAATVTLSAQAGTPYALNLPGSQPTPGNTFLSCTAANPSNCSWAAGGGGSSAWSSLTNPTGNLTLSMAANTSTFNFTSGVSNSFLWANTTAATVTTSQSSPQLTICGNAWVGSSNQDCLTIQHIPGNGLNAAISDSYGHAGSSTGIVTSNFSGPVAAGAGSGLAGAIIIPQGTSNPTTPSAITIQGGTAITAYSLALPNVAPTAGSTLLSCTAATASICTWQSGNPNSLPGFVDGHDFLISDLAHGQMITDGSWSNSSSTLNSAGQAQWTNAIVGDTVYATNGCRTGTPGSATGIDTSAVIVPVGIVNTVNSATQIVVSTTSTAAVASGGCIVIGVIQDTAMASISTAVSSQKAICPTVSLPAGVFLITTPPLFMDTQPTSCANSGVVEGNEFGGAGGYLIRGQGQNATTIVLTPTFVPDSRCGAGTSALACFFIPSNATWRDFRITGAGNAMNGRADNTKFALETGGYTGMRDIMLDQWGGGDTGFIGLHGNGNGVSWVFETTIDAFASIPVQDNNNQTLYRNFMDQNSCGTSAFNIGASATIESMGKFIIQNPGIAGLCSVSSTARTMMNMVGANSVYLGGPQDAIVLTGGTSSSVGINVCATCIVQAFMADEVDISTGNGGRGIVNSGTVKMCCGSFVENDAGGASNTIVNNSGAKFQDFAATSYTAGGGTVNNAGTFLGSMGQVGGTQLATGNIGLTSGWGTSSVASVAAGSDSHQGKFTITGAAGAASPTLTLTFPQAYAIAPASCILFETGANDLATLTSVSAAAPSATSVVFTFAGTPAAVTYVFDYRCGP